LFEGLELPVNVGAVEEEETKSMTKYGFGSPPASSNRILYFPFSESVGQHRTRWHPTVEPREESLKPCFLKLIDDLMSNSYQ
jgi:hypothetical protein